MSTRFPPFASRIAAPRSSMLGSSAASAPSDSACWRFSSDEAVAITRLRNRDVDELQHLRSAELRDLNGAHDGRTLSGQDIDRLVRICIDSHIGLDQSGWSKPGPAGGRGGHMATEHAAPVPATDR